MPFTIRKFHRLPVHGSVTYQRGMAEGRGTAWNTSLTGAQFSGDLPQCLPIFSQKHIVVNSSH